MALDFFQTLPLHQKPYVLKDYWIGMKLTEWRANIRVVVILINLKASDHFWYLVMPTRYNTKAMAVKLFLDNILLLDVYSFEGFSNRHKNDGMVNNNNIIQMAVTSSNFKNPLILPKIVSNMVFDTTG